MSCRGTRATAIALLVVALLFSSLLLPHVPTACARHVAVLKPKDGLNVAGEDAGKAGGSRPARTVEMRAAAARKHRWDELHDMLRKDYAAKPHAKRPGHNDEPLRQEDEP
ncbi:unnamed protein product [Alopecurus aequalis]